MNQLNPSKITILANTLAVAFSEHLTAEEQNVFGNLFTLVGASLLSMAAINASNSAIASSSDAGSSDSADSAGSDANSSKNSGKTSDTLSQIQSELK